MNDEQLERSLRSIGKECFVKYYELFQDRNWSKEDLIEHLIASGRGLSRVWLYYSNIEI